MSIDLYVHIVLFVENIQNLIGHFEQLFVFENLIYIGNLLNYVSFIGALLVIFLQHSCIYAVVSHRKGIPDKPAPIRTVSISLDLTKNPPDVDKFCLESGDFWSNAHADTDTTQIYFSGGLTFPCFSVLCY